MPIPANTGTFDELFTFSRARSGQYTDATGESLEAAINVPRLDFESGAAKGLLIEGRGVSYYVDACGLAGDLPNTPTLGTILHEYITAMGDLRRVAIFTRTPQATLAARLAICGHHRRLGYFPQFLSRDLERPGGPVRFSGLDWEMAGLVLVDELTALDLGAEKLLIEG